MGRYSPLKAILPPHHGLLVCGVLCALLGPLAGLFCCGLPSWVKHLEPLPRQGHCVEMQMRVGLVCVLHHGAQPLAVLLPQPRHGGFTKAGPVLALLSGQGHHPSSQGEAIGAQLAPLGVLAAVGPVVGQLRGLRWGAAVQHLGRLRLLDVRAGVRLAHGLGGDLARRPFARLAVLLEPWRAYASMCRN